MAQPSTMQGDFRFLGAVNVAGQFTFPDGSVDNNSISLANPIATQKLIHRMYARHSQNTGADVVAETVPLHAAAFAGTSIEVRCRVETAPAGGDKTFSVEVQKAADLSTTYATIQSAPIQFAAGDPNGSTKTAVLTVTPISPGDQFRLVVTIAGTTGAQAQGFTVTLIADENPTL